MESTGAGDRKLPPGTWGLSRDSGSGGLGGVEGGLSEGVGGPGREHGHLRGREGGAGAHAGSTATAGGRGQG